MITFVVETIEIPVLNTIDEWLDYKNDINKDETIPQYQKDILHCLANVEIEKLWL